MYEQAPLMRPTFQAPHSANVWVSCGRREEEGKKGELRSDSDMRMFEECRRLKEGKEYKGLSLNRWHAA